MPVFCSVCFIPSGAVVRGEDHQCVFSHIGVFQRAQNSAYMRVDHVHEVAVQIDPTSGTAPEDPDFCTALKPSGDPQPFGRRFKVLSIRQLSADDV